MKDMYKVNSSKSQMAKANSDTDKTKSVMDVKPEAGTFRRILPQILATTAKNFLLLDLGLSVAFPTIVIPALMGLNNENNPNEMIQLTAVQASWLGSIGYICEPLGSVVSGWISEPLGRKRAMLVVNIPHLIAWLLLYNATELWHIFLANILLGLGVGLMEAPILTYVGEICQPSIRGMLIAMAGIAATLGLFLVFLLGSLTAWRNVALICFTVPIATLIAICFIPETPLWLLSKNRPADAQKSLQWLRGWVSPKAVQLEFDELQRYNEMSNACTKCTKANVKCTHPSPTTTQKLQELLRKRNLKPFVLLSIAFMISQFSGVFAMRPYIVQILKSYGIPISPNRATVFLGVTGICGTLTCVCIVKWVGKRRLYLASSVGLCLSIIGLASHGFRHLPSGWTSFDKHPDDVFLGSASYFPLLMFIAMSFFTSLGVAAVPFMMMSELFPFKSRGFATGIAAAANYCMQFVATKTYYNLEMGLSLPGVASFYAVIAVMGLVIMYFLLPETENRTLEDIELHFSDNKRKLTDIYIRKGAAANNNRLPPLTEDTSKDVKSQTPSMLVMNEKSEPKLTGCVNQAFNGDDGQTK